MVEKSRHHDNIRLATSHLMREDSVMSLYGFLDRRSPTSVMTYISRKERCRRTSEVVKLTVIGRFLSDSYWTQKCDFLSSYSDQCTKHCTQKHSHTILKNYNWILLLQSKLIKWLMFPLLLQQTCGIAEVLAQETGLFKQKCNLFQAWEINVKSFCYTMKGIQECTWSAKWYSS